MTRVYIVAASSALRRGLQSLVESLPGFSVIGSSSAADTATLEEAPADILLIEPSPHDGMSVLPLKGDRRDGPALVLLSDEPSSGWTADGVRAGVRAVLPRAASDEQIVGALQAVAAGFMVMSPEQWLRTEPIPATDALTARETDVLRMLAEGHGNKTIGARLGISENTVKFHISAILGKLHAATRTEAVTIGIRRGLLML